MKKIVFSIVMVIVLLLSTASTVFAEDYIDDIPKDDHKIRTKWDLTGTFISSRSWGTVVPVGSTWTYDIHIKEAMNGELSKGVIVFTSGDTVVTAHVDATKTDYAYWHYTGDPYDTWANLAAVGWAEYNDAVYNFMFLYSEGAIWIALSDYTYDTEWDGDTVWLGSLRDYDLLSVIDPDTYEFDPKFIH